MNYRLMILSLYNGLTILSLYIFNDLYLLTDIHLHCVFFSFFPQINQSNLEFNVRMQEYVELVRKGDKMEAVRYVSMFVMCFILICYFF